MVTGTVSRRRFLRATGGAATAAALAGCAGGADGDGEDATPDGQGDGGDGGGGDTGGPTPEPQTGGTLRLINASMTTLDPISATDTASGTVIQNLFDGLTNYPNAETAVERQLATDYTTSDDFTTYTFRLAEDATFHDGSPVTAADFVYAWERLAGSKHSRRQYFVLDSLGVSHETADDGSYVPGSLEVEATGERELTVSLEDAFHATLEVLAYTAFAAVPEGIVGDVEGYEGEQSQSDFATTNPVGAGPFRFDRWEQGTRAAVRRFDDYHGDVAHLDGVEWRIIEDPNAAYEYSMNENSDLVSMPTAKYDPGKVSVEREDGHGRGIGTYGPLRNGKTADYLRVPEVGTFYFGFNTDRVPKPVRQAIAYATNQNQFAEQVFKNRQAPAYHLTPPVIYPGGPGAYTAHAEERYPYGYDSVELEKAREVMEAAGYGPDNRYALTWTQYVSDTWKQMAGILRDRLGSAYIDMEITEAQFSTLLERGRNGNLEVFTLGWIADWPAADNFLQLIYPPRTLTSEPGPLSYTNWTDTDASRRARRAFERVLNNRAPTDEAQAVRDEAYVAMEEANWEDVVFVNTFHSVSERFAYDHVHVPTFGAMGASRQMHNRTWKEH